LKNNFNECVHVRYREVTDQKLSLNLFEDPLEVHISSRCTSIYET